MSLVQSTALALDAASMPHELVDVPNIEPTFILTPPAPFLRDVEGFILVVREAKSEIGLFAKASTLFDRERHWDGLMFANAANELANWPRCFVDSEQLNFVLMIMPQSDAEAPSRLGILAWAFMAEVATLAAAIPYINQQLRTPRDAVEHALGDLRDTARNS